MKYLISHIVLLLTLSSCGLSQGHGSHNKIENNQSSTVKVENIKSGEITNFPAVGFKVVYKDTISYPLKKVFPLFEPQGRSLLYENWDPTILREGNNESLKGQILFSKYDEMDVMLTVTEYDPEIGHIQYLVIWDDFELQRIDINCVNGNTENSTEITWIEHNAGLYEKGVPLVSMFVEEGFLVKAVQRYIENVKTQLNNGN